MGVFTYETESTSVIPPAKLFKAFILDADKLIPNAVPHAIQVSEITEGNGGSGTIKKITFGEGSKFKHVKHKVDEVDNKNFTYGYRIIEDDGLSNIIEKISYEIKIVESPDGGSILKSISYNHIIADHEIKEEQVKAGKEKASGLFKAVEGYLLAHPDAYN